MTAIAARTAAARPPAARPVAERPTGAALSHFRLMLLLLLFGAGALLVVARIGFLAATPANAGVRAAAAGPRADIVDRNGVPLARTIDAWSVGIHPSKVIGDKRLLARRLAELMPEKTPAQYLAILNSDRTFTYLRRRAMPELVAAVNALGEPGVALAREPQRLYPGASMAAHVLGYLDVDGRGMAGVERLIDRGLAGGDGRPVELSIDSRVQAALEAELYAAMTKHSAIGATGLVVDVATGELIAMASMPVYNPNRPGRVDPEALRNNVTQSVYELGSTFKPLTLAAAIEAGTVTDLSKKYDATHALAIGRFRITDFPRGQNRPLNTVEMLVHSSNIVTARVADELGAARLSEFFRRMNFHQPPDIELIEKGRPLFPGTWSRATLLTAGYGHGVAITPLHLAAAYAALVNGGTWRPLTLLKRDAAHIPAGRRVMSAETSHLMTGLLRMVAIDGSGKNANAPGFRVGGKTGTADKAGAGGYRGGRVSTFASAFPMDDPRYVVIAMLDDPKATADTYGYATAGWVTAPLVGRLIPRIAPMLGVFPDEGREADIERLRPLVWKPRGG